ncbi:MAG: helix-turn-helix transcriptional regulator [Actinomycetota bacterium]|nr:helix-turn-helix transcriptional regulator [Actinomycetota bacterium]
MAPPGGQHGRDAAPSLGEFLRERRMRIQPEQVGISRGRGSRQHDHPGLRREEVAELADISVAYYTFIERGRDVRPSPEVLNSIGRVMQLTAGELRLLQDLRTGEPRRPTAMLTEIGDEVEELASVLEPNPTYVMGARWDLLHWNRAAELLFTNWHRRPVNERNMLWFYFCDPYARRLYLDWEGEARTQIAHFRESYSQYGHDPSFMQLLEEIFEITPQARSWWERHDAPPNRSGSKRVRLPDNRDVCLRQLVLEVADNPEVQIVTYFASWDEDDTDDDNGDDSDNSDDSGPDELEDDADGQ